MDKKTLCLILAAAFLFKLGLALVVPLTPDESLHWMQGRHLAWGFRDHPPVTAFLSFASRSLLGVSLPSARIFAILSTTLCPLIAYGILRETGHDERSAGRDALRLQLIPMFAFGCIMVPVFPFAGIVFAAEYFFVRALQRNTLRDYLACGFFLGAAGLSYYVAVTAVLAVIVFCIIDAGGRRCLASGRFWAGMALAAAIVAPNVWWNIAQGSQSAVYFQVVRRSPYAFRIDHFVSFILLTILITGPILLPAAIRAVSCIRRRSPRDEVNWGRFFAVAWAVPLLGFLALSLFREAGAHWAVVSFLNAPLVVASGRRNGKGSRIWFGAETAFPALILVVSAAALAAGPMRCVERWDPAGRFMGLRKGYLLFDAAAAADAAHRWKESLSAEGHDVRFATDKWGAGGVLSFYTPGHPYYFVMPRPDRHGQDYVLWNTKHDYSGDFIYVRSGRKLDREIRRACREVEPLELTGIDESKSYGIYLCKGLDPSRGR